MALVWKRQEPKQDFVTGTNKDVPAAAPPPSREPHSLPGIPAKSPGAPPVGASPAPLAGASPATGAADAAPVGATPPRGFFSRIKVALADRLKRTKQEIVGQIREAVKAAGKVDENLIERIEEILIQADLGAETTAKLVAAMKEFEARGSSGDQLLASFKQQLHQIVGHGERTLCRVGHRPYVLLMVGVNGVGKTTTIGKLAAEFQGTGVRTMIVAGDTFRAAAVDQLRIWAERTGAEFMTKGMGADPSGIAYDAVSKASAEGYDVVLIDTAGRLHTKTNLMDELKKIHKVIERVLPGAPHETLLVLDATTGQNAISQAKVFTEAIPVTGIVMTKLDGTAKGGVLIGIRNLFSVPIVKIGVGEAAEDLRDFDPGEFVEALFAE